MTEELVADAEVVLYDSGMELSRQPSDRQGLAHFDVPEGNYRVVAKFQQMTRGLEVQVKPPHSQIVVKLAKP